MLPRVILHSGASVDGRIDWLTMDMGLFYGLAAILAADAMLTGADTMLAAYAAPVEEGEPAPEADAPAGDADESHLLLAIVDSRGRIEKWPRIQREPWWRQAIALCAESTPRGYLDHLEALGVEYIVAGEERVDLRAALEALHQRYGVETVQVDSGGTLAGAMLRAGLVDEVSLIVAPMLTGGTSPRSIYRAPDLESADGIIPLELLHAEAVEGGHVWLRYAVIRPGT
ncbi:MAG: RibD family protein [Anaerolineae bacterium]|nr:RibD family protein [Anaerolineae bacterium]